MQMEDRDTLKKLTLFSVTWPIFIESFLHMLMGSADTFMLSIVSDEAVAAVGLANQVVFFVFILFNFVGAGTGVVVAQYLGAGRIVEASKISANAIALNFVFGFVMSILVVVFSGAFLRLLNTPPELFDMANQYLQIVGSMLFLQALLLTVGAVIRTNGYTRDSMFVTIVMNVLNVAGNYVFIFGALGFPQLGVPGVAYSTVFSRLVALVILVVLLYRRLQVPIESKDYLQWDPMNIRKILKIGIPSAGENLAYHMSQMVIIVFITMLGTTALATRIYTMNILFYMMLFGIAIGQGTQIIIGRMVGAGKNEEAYQQLLRSLRLSLIITVAAVLVIILFREALLGIFTDDPEIIRIGSILLLFGIILEPGRTFNLVVINSLRAAGDAQFPVIMAMISMWGISVPLAYFLGIYLNIGLLGIWIAFAVDEWFRGILMYIRWKSRVWEKKVLVQQKG